MTLKETIDIWKDKREIHRLIFERYADCVNASPELKSYRDFVEQNIFGFGERSFLWLWKLLCDEQKEGFKFLEIGVFRGQILGLIGLLRPDAKRFGVTPLDNTGGHWDSDYEKDIKYLHETFKIKKDYHLFVGLSTDPEIVDQANQFYDLVYIDGGHAYEVVKSDLENYPPLVRPGGYLVIDDCCNDYDLPDGYFRGIDSVTQAVREWDKKGFKEQFSVGHNRVFIKS